MSTEHSFFDALGCKRQRSVHRCSASGSMNEPGRQEQLEAHLAALRSAGVEVQDPVETFAFGVSTEGADQNFLHSLERLVTAGNVADTVYLFSDFDVQSPLYDSDNAEGFQRLCRLLREYRLRLYLGTVLNPPSKRLVATARESGGDLIKASLGKR